MKTTAQVIAALTPERLVAIIRELAGAEPAAQRVGVAVERLMIGMLREVDPRERHAAYGALRGAIYNMAAQIEGLRYVESAS